MGFSSMVTKIVGCWHKEEIIGIFYLINNTRMFNLRIDDLAEKPYIPQENLPL